MTPWLTIDFPEEGAGDGDIAGNQDGEDEAGTSKPAHTGSLARRLDPVPEEPSRQFTDERAYQASHCFPSPTVNATEGGSLCVM